MGEPKSDLERPVTWQFRRRPPRRLTRYVVAVGVFCLFLLQFSKFVRDLNRFTRIQHDFNPHSPEARPQDDRLKAVKKEFMHAWYGYKDHAWMADSLMPLTGGRRNEFCGWSATLVDSLDTLWIMDLKDEFDEAVEATTTINFKGSAARCQVNTFESTIRYLGGILAAYDLSLDQRLLPKIVELGELLHEAFDTTNGMPCSHRSLGVKNSSMVHVPGVNVPLADVASLYLEFARLSQITRERKYMDSVRFLTNVFENAQHNSSIPGLWPDMVNASSIEGPNAKFVKWGNMYSLGALSDSAYEYLVKAHLMLGGMTHQYRNMWIKAAQPIRRFLIFRAYIPEWDTANIMFSGLAVKDFDQEDILLEPRTQHLACFAGGMFAMASRIFNKPSDLAIGEGLTNGCVWAYRKSPSGIMPETFTLLPCPMGHPGQCAWNATVWSLETGIAEECIDQECPDVYRAYPTGYTFSLDEHYGLRPEAIESVFILYRVTGDPKWRDIGWEMFQSIIKHTRTPYGHAALASSLHFSNDTIWERNQETFELKPPQKDQMESFWLAETLKYFWLLFSNSTLVDLDEWVLNTEAHPLKLKRGSRGFP